MENLVNYELLEEIHSFGHDNVLATHNTTLEITTENYLTKRGNCIISINCDKSVNDFCDKLKDSIQNGEKILVHLTAGTFHDEFTGYGNSNLTLANKTSIVFRKSDFISDRTALIHCSKTSLQLDRKLIDYLKDATNELITTFYRKKIQE